MCPKKTQIISRLEREGIGVIWGFREIRPLWPRTVRVDSSRAHAPHRVAAPTRMRETESLRRHTHVPVTYRRSVPVPVTADCAVPRIPRVAFGSTPGLPAWNEVLRLCRYP